MTSNLGELSHLKNEIQHDTVKQSAALTPPASDLKYMASVADEAIGKNSSDKNVMELELTIQNDSFAFASSISSALEQAEWELQALNETIDSVQGLKPECDKLDYILAASSGALCGIIDIFLVAKPGQSILGNITDEWFASKTMSFAKLCGWKGEGEKSAKRFLEQRFKIPYDQRGRGDAASFIFDLSPSNHHFKSLGHNPTLCGLFFSILDQFTNTSHFVSGGQLISLEKADDKFELRGHNLPSKLFCAFVNWFGHLISDMSGSSGSRGRGMGIPSPFWAWTNDVIAVKNSLHIPASKFDETMNDLALHIFENGYDMRFQTAQAIPVFINELIVRMIYSVRRMLKYFSNTAREEWRFQQLWHTCEPFSNVTVKRMLTVAHGTFCVLDIGDAVIHGYIKSKAIIPDPIIPDPTEVFLRLNIVGVGRFAISLYGEGKRALSYWKAEKDAMFAKREKVIIDDYMKGLNLLACQYDDHMLLTFVDDLRSSDLYLSAFQKTANLAELRGAPQENILRDKSDIDLYFEKR